MWDLQARCIKVCAYNFTICHEGYYPFKDKANWPPDFIEDPICFSPTLGGVLTMPEWKKYKFDDDDTEEILSQAPDLVVTRPDPIMPEAPETKEVAPMEKIHVSPPSSPIPPRPPPVPAPPSIPFPEPIVPTRRSARNFTPSLASLESIPDVDIPPTVNFVPSQVPDSSSQDENFSLWGHLTDVQNHKPPDLSDPFAKPVGIAAPETLREAKQSPWWPQYRKAAEDEIKGHEDSKTWILVPHSSLPKGTNILRGKWVFDDKRGEDGKMTRFKARYVAMGFTQKKNVDYFDTFAGVVIGKSFRIMLAILNENSDNEFEHWDVKMAFTQAILHENIYMFQPECFEKDGKNFVCKLLKSLYGLKQSAKKLG